MSERVTLQDIARTTQAERQAGLEILVERLYLRRGVTGLAQIHDLVSSPNTHALRTLPKEDLELVGHLAIAGLCELVRMIERGELFRSPS